MSDEQKLQDDFLTQLTGYQPSPDALQGKTVMITGSTDGIGKALAIECAELGAEVILHGRNQDKLNALYDEIDALPNSARPATLCLDLSQAREPDYIQLAGACQENFQKIDALIHNAGILGDPTSIEHYPASTFDQVLKVNLQAPFMLTKVLLPLLKAAKQTNVIYTSSSVGRQGRAEWGAYSISKFGIEALMQILAQELEYKQRFCISSLNPGATATKMRANAYPGEDPKTLLTPEDKTKAFIYLMDQFNLEYNGAALNCLMQKS
jgi:NAD(P)-dependent dehydrogenase (short-subunit alcohol dehydrogenase family)